VPDGFALHENYPNPFNPSTTIGYTIPKSGNLTLVVYDVTGREIRTLESGAVTPGYHSVRWDGRDNRGSTVSSGAYFFQLRVSGGFVQTRKMILSR
jgi:flagellar hook assembly protein FlgD